MSNTHPIPDACPEFSIIRDAGSCEYRVENKEYGGSQPLWSMALDPLGLSVLSLAITQLKYPKLSILIAVFCALVIWSKCTRILHESVIVLPPHGVQLETHRGFRAWSFVSRRFVHRHSLRSVFIHEGFKTWNVKYYLAFVKVVDAESKYSIEVAFENLLPNCTILREVYLGTRKLLEEASST